MILSRLFGFLGKRLAMDLGTANTLVFTRRGGIVLNEPSVVAIDTRTETVMAVGREAKEFLGRTPERIRVVRPLKDGVIADFGVAQAMIAHFVRKGIGRRGLVKPAMVIGVPNGITQVEKRAVIDSAQEAGAGQVWLIEEPMAAAIGAGLPIHEPGGNLVVDVGGGTSEVAVITLSAIAYAESVRVAGDELTEAVQRYLLERHRLSVGENTAERVKLTVGSAAPLPEPLSMEVSGKHVVDGRPTTITVTDADIREAMAEPVNTIVTAVRRALEKTPPELVADIAGRGILLAGGGALLRGLDRRIAEAAKVAVRIDDDPLTTIVRGAGKTLDDLSGYRRVFIN